MEGFIKPIGGEFWFDINFLYNLDNDVCNNFDNNENFIYLDGGQSAINFIIHNIKMKENEYILLPSYLCTNIIDIFIKSDVNIIFYNVNKELEIDIDHLLKQIRKYNVRAIYFIDYFGFYHSNEIIRVLKSLKDNGIILIEDAVQLLWIAYDNNFIGDYVFNSYRKFLPIDGSVLIKKDNSIINCQKRTYDNYYNLINTARIKKTLFQEFGIGTQQEYLELFKLAEHEYLRRNNSIFEMSTVSKKLLSKINFDFIRNVRYKNFEFIYDKIKENKKIRILFTKEKLESNIPLGFPILIDNRDKVRNSLISKSIYCPVHWNIKFNYIPNVFNDAYYLSQHILTLPIDQRYNIENMNRLIDELYLII